MMEAVRTSETSVDNYFTRQYIPEDNSELTVSGNSISNAIILILIFIITRILYIRILISLCCGHIMVIFFALLILLFSMIQGTL